MSAAAQLRIAALAADRGVHRAFGWLHLHELRLRQWQLQLLAVPAPPFAEHARATWFFERFRELGLRDAAIDAEGNVLGCLPGIDGADTERVVLLSAHLDTVFPAGTPCTPVEDGPRILCPGACDNGAGLTALLGLAAALQVSGLAPPCTLLFCANVGEEGEGDLRGMKHLFAPPGLPGSLLHGKRVAAAIALEGAGEATVVDRALGSRRFRVTVTGPGGHSWADAGRLNPIFALSEALAAVSRLALPSAPRTTLHCGTIRGGTSINSIPEDTSATLDLRSVSEDQLRRSAEDIHATLHAAVASHNARSPAQQPLRLAVESIGDRPAAALATDSPLFDSLRAVDRHLGIATEPRIGSTDANLPLSLGVPALAIGSGGVGGGIHTLAEWYDPTGRELALRRVLLLLLDACFAAVHS